MDANRLRNACARRGTVAGLWFSAARVLPSAAQPGDADVPLPASRASRSLFWPGLQDITAHVDFSGIADAALATGAELLGYTSQARFLINSGIADALAELDPL